MPIGLETRCVTCNKVSKITIPDEALNDYNPIDVAWMCKNCKTKNNCQFNPADAGVLPPAPRPPASPSNSSHHHAAAPQFQQYHNQPTPPQPMQQYRPPQPAPPQPMAYPSSRESLPPPPPPAADSYQYAQPAHPQAQPRPVNPSVGPAHSKSSNSQDFGRKASGEGSKTGSGPISRSQSPPAGGKNQKTAADGKSSKSKYDKWCLAKVALCIVVPVVQTVCILCVICNGDNEDGGAPNLPNPEQKQL